MDTMTIGEVASAVGVSPKAIRLWEARGLLPTTPRTALGHRTFTDADLASARFIRQAKALGLTLREIRDIIHLQQAGIRPCKRVIEAIDAHLFTIDQQIADLVQLRSTLTVARSTTHDQAPCPQGSSVECYIIEKAMLSKSSDQNVAASRTA